ncbi:MAG: glycosyl hydrolase family 59 [Oscillospiraceae bacterium]|nr:glycosyl hydrolase family 59 [Oscillospiraceae bacterium]
MNALSHRLEINAETKGLSFEGMGIISANGSSRLLPDYKRLHPDKYWDILRLLFDKDRGLGLALLKIEMGSDVNSSSGTEANIMRTPDEAPDITRCVGMEIAADAKTINPDLILDMLWWSTPKWTDEAYDPYAARYEWYKAHLTQAYERYRLKFDLISGNRNERAVESEWLKYLKSQLLSDKCTPYDFSQIKIVAADECGTWNIADVMTADEGVRNAVDIIGSHYTSDSSDNARALLKDHGKRLWFSEGSPPMSYCEGVKRFDGSGLSGINGLLDVANRIITMYARGRMTMYEFQPAVSAYYDGVCYCHKELINASTPNSGYYRVNGGYYMALHFTRFIKKGWHFIDSGCFADGTNGGDGHCIVNGTYNCLSAANFESGDYSAVLTNTTKENITYNISVGGLQRASGNVYVWETDKNGFLKKTREIIPINSGDSFTYDITLSPDSLVTITTLDLPEFSEKFPDPSENTVFPLPYKENFDYPENFLESRGGKPLYTTDQGGAFEVADAGQYVLMQMITEDLRASEWGYTPDPVTCFGDSRWWNYTLTAGVCFEKTSNPQNNFVGIGVRHSLPCEGEWGAALKLYENGKWEMRINKKLIAHGMIKGVRPYSFHPYEEHTLTLTASGNIITCRYRQTLLCEIICSELPLAVPLPPSGGGALYSSFNKNYFTFFKVTPEETPYINFINNTDYAVSYSGDWKHEIMGSFKNYLRTYSKGTPGCTADISFCGSGIAGNGIAGNGIAIVAQTEGFAAEISIDDGTPETISRGSADYRECVYYKTGLASGSHILHINITDGSLDLDGVLIEP